MDGLSRTADSGGSAIHNVPPEIIIAILENLVASSQNLPFGRRYQYLIRFTHVSSQLRNTAISTPTLWTQIEITDLPATFELAKTCLQRSGEQRLNINIRVMSRMGTKLPGILALINHTAVRTRRLMLNLVLKRGHQWLETQKALQALVFPCLGYLELIFRDEGSWEELQTTSLPVQVPKLRCLVTRTLLPSVEPTVLKNLKKLVISSSTHSSWPLGRLQDVLNECKRLEILELIAKLPGSNMPVRHTAPGESTRQNLPNLVRLTVKGQSSQFFPQLLLGLDAPKLEEVELGFVSERLAEPADWPSTHHAFHSVRLLSVSVLPYGSHTQAQQFLPKAFPNVEELALSMHGWPILDAFTALPDGEGSLVATCWNELRGLRVADPDPYSSRCGGRCMMRLEAVKSFLEVRSSRSLPRLKWAQVGSCGFVALEAGFDSTVEGIRAMLDEDEGLSFLVTRQVK
ncbi:hypothetical protein FRC01_005841, partial [Tulasnella sp. 417]